MPVWPFCPSGITEALIFRTDIQSGPAGEHRLSLHDAVQHFDLSYVLEDAPAARAEILFRGREAEAWDLPSWHERSIVAGISSGTTVLSIDTEADYRDEAIIWQDHRTWEVVPVASAAGGTLTLSSGVVGDYTGSVSVMPLLPCVAREPLSYEDHFAVSRLKMALAVVDPVDPGESPWSQFGGYDVFADGRTYQAPLSAEIKRDLAWRDNQYGSFGHEEIGGYSRQVSTVTCMDWTVSDRWERRKWLHHTRGRWGVFWLPSGKHDLPLVSAASSGGSYLTIVPTTPYIDDLEGRAIQIDVDGARQYRTISGVVLNGSNHDLALSSALTADVPIDARISLMSRVRFATDRFEIGHERTAGGFVSTMVAPVVEVLQ